MPINIQRSVTGTTPAQDVANLTAIKDALDEVYDNDWLSIGGWTPVNAGGPTAIVVVGGNGQAPLLSFPTGQAHGAVWTIRPKLNWNNHQILLRIVYSASGGSVTPFNIRLDCFGYAAGTTLSGGGPVQVGSVTVTPAGPAVTNTILTTSVTLANSGIIPTFEFLELGFIRRGDLDSNANSLYLAGIYWQVVPLKANL